MLCDGGNADEENQDADGVGLEPQDVIGVHGKRSARGAAGVDSHNDTLWNGKIRLRQRGVQLRLGDLLSSCWVLHRFPPVVL